MKKTLYSTTALAAAGLLTFGASDAFAQAAAPEKLKMSVGGFFNVMAGFAQQDSDFERANATTGTATGGHYNAFDVKNDSELKFSGSVKLDNGMSVRVQLEFETDPSTATGSGTSLDESYLALDTNGLGEVRIGTQKFTMLTLGVGGPSGAGMLNPGNSDTSLWVVRPSTGMTVGAALGFPSGADNQRIAYISPVIGGFRFGIDHQPGTANDDNMPLNGGTSAGGTNSSAVLQYSGKFGDVGFRSSISTYVGDAGGTGSNNGAEFGMEFTIGDIKFGGLVHRQWSPSNTGTNSNENEGFQAGIEYNPGPWRVGLRTTQHFAEGARANTNKDTAKLYKLGANYVLGPGVELTGDLFRLAWEDEAKANASSNTGWALVGGIAVAF